MNRIGLLVVVAAAAYFAAFVHYGILLEDEGLILLQIARTFRGERPYLDFHTGYTPGGFYLNAALFHAFGESVVPIRWLLVAVNAASAGLLYALARPLAGRALAAAAALGWAAHLPVFVGLFAAFNVPYPSWYGICAFLATQLAFARYMTTGRRAALVAAGLAAGVAFAIKQNAGALAVVACGLTLALERAGTDDRDRHVAHVLLVLAGAFLLVGFTVAVTTVEAAIILGPTLLLLAGRLGWARAPLPSRTRLVPALAIVAAGTIAVSLVWLVPFLGALGFAGLLREIFLVGTDFDLVYATPYPMPLGFPDAWGGLASFALAGLAACSLAVERGRLGRRTLALLLALGAMAFGATFLHWARMPEGTARAITVQVQHLGFYAAPLTHLVLVVAWLRRVRDRAGPARSLDDPQLLCALVFALCMYAKLYPRIDDTHLLIALPSTVVIAAWVAARLATAWARMLDVPAERIRGVIAAGAIALALLAVVPSFRALVRLDGGRPAARAMVPVDSPRAPVAMDDVHASDVQALNALLAYLRARLGPDEGIFHFPGLALVPFLLGHPSVTRHDYWYAGRPDHLEEAIVVRNLAAHPPRFAVTVNRNIGFFSNSARYYFLLRELMRERYVLAARFGRYDVLARRDVAQGPPVVEAHEFDVGGDWRAALAQPLHEPRYAVARALLARARTADGVRMLAAELAPDEPMRLLLIRAFAEVPDVHTIPYLADVFDEGSSRLRAQAGVTLNFVALATMERRYLLGRLPDEPLPSPSDLVGTIELSRARDWLRAIRPRSQVGTFATTVLAAVSDREAIPLFQEAARPLINDSYLRLMAAYALVRAGRTEYLCDLVDFLGEGRHDFQEAIPSLLLDLAPVHPDALALCLRRGLIELRPRGRETSAWVAGAAGVRGVLPALRGTLEDPERRVRIAAAWALGRLGDRTDRPELERLAHEEDEETRAFAAEALVNLDRAP